MTPLLWLVVFFLIITVLSIFVYVITVKTFYWGDKKEPIKKNQDKKKTENL